MSNNFVNIVGPIGIPYKKFKRTVYYDKTQLHLRKRLAEFEADKGFLERLQELDLLLKTKAPAESNLFQKWLKEIDYRLLPKSVSVPETEDCKSGRFISNVTTDKDYPVNKVNYYFDGPIELYIISVLWLTEAGYRLDTKLTENVMGSRLHTRVGKPQDNSSELFKLYQPQYAKWRDDGINKAQSLLTEEKRDISIVALDLQEFFYRVDVDWEEVRKITKGRDLPLPRKSKDEVQKYLPNNGGRLLDCVRLICEQYFQAISPLLAKTHPDIIDNKLTDILPIGLPVSPVIANWQLRHFDEQILEKVRPAYYGRYVDDIILVVPAHCEPGKDPIAEFMKKVMVDAKIVKWRDTGERYELSCCPGQYLQKEKCILQYFEAKHSIAGLEKFRKQLQENSSEFGLLPLDDEPSLLEQVAYELLYDGSTNKLRSVQKLGENRWELAKHLAKQTAKHLIVGEKLDPETKQELFHFFKGRNAINYWDMWERVVAFLIVSDGWDSAQDFLKVTHREIKKTKLKGHEKKVIPSKLNACLIDHLDWCMELGEALLGTNFPDADSSGGVWRRANLIRHHLVAIPLLNYTHFDGDYTAPTLTPPPSWDHRTIDTSPRHVHFDECAEYVARTMCPTNSPNVIEDIELSAFEYANDVYRSFHGRAVDRVFETFSTSEMEDSQDGE